MNNNQNRPASRPPIEVRNEIVIRASAEGVWELLADVARWPSWWRLCKWVRVESTDSAARATSFRWKAHPVELRSTVIAADRPRSFAITADGMGVRAVRRFTITPAPDATGVVVVSDETQEGPLPWLGRLILGPRLRKANQAMFEDLARAVGKAAVNRATSAA
jgi:uncharacterized protein YndB with AHSA1/START domain